MHLRNQSILIIGQLKTSRTETLEEFLKFKVGSLAVIGLISPCSVYIQARCTLYEKGKRIKNLKLLNFSMKEIHFWNKFLLLFSYLVYVFAVFIAVIRLKRKFDLFIGISTFPSLLGFFLKKLGKVKRSVYYCIDYYPPGDKKGLDKIINILFRKIDAWLIKKSDIIWDISPKIKEARKRYMNIAPQLYQSIIVPLGYANEIYRSFPLADRERWTLGFVGTINKNQGLQIVVEAMPRLAEKYPNIRVRILGHGPYAAELKRHISEKSVEDRFIFHGFVNDDNEVYDLLSRCVAGLATWRHDKDDNSQYADPGKPKLYALLGLPIIITSAPWVSKQIAETGAGEVINYDLEDFIIAVDKIIGSNGNFLRYVEGINRFRPFCLAEDIFNRAFSEINNTSF